MIKDYYYKSILGQILIGEHEEIKSLIDEFLENEDEGRTFENMTINEAVEFLKENWEDHFNDLLK